MFASFKALKCQSGAEKKENGDEGVPESSLPTPARSPKSTKPKLARRISRWKMDCPLVDDGRIPLQGDALDLAYADARQPNGTGVKTAATTVNIERDDGTLGITLRGGMLPNNQLSKPVVITQLKPGGPADREGTIKPGDRLVAVNGVSLRGSSLVDAQALLKQPATATALTIEYDIKLIDSMLRVNGPLVVEIQRMKAEDLGLTLHQNESGVFIQQVKHGSIADRCGALSEGDEILAINNTRIDSLSLNVEDVNRMLEENTTNVLLEILPSGSMMMSSRILRERTGKTEEAVSTTACGWYGSGAVTHCEKLHTMVVRDHTGFGLSLGTLPGGTLLIADVDPNSPAERSGCLYPGDRVLAVNHRSVALDNLTAQDAANLLEASPGGRLTLHVEFDVLDTVIPASGVFNVRLIKRGASGLGLTIAASKEHEFVVCEVKKGSPAHRSGSLLPGDRLLAVNGTPLDQCSAEHITQILHHGDELITLKVERLDQPQDLRCNRKVTCTVELQRYGGPIGITIAGSEEPCQPIVVSGLTSGGLAEQTGALLVGDEILAINDRSLLGQPLSAAHALLHTSPDLVCLKISRHIVPNGRTPISMSPLQPPSVDSAVESWGSSHIDLTPSPDHSRPVPASSVVSQKQADEWVSSTLQRANQNSQLFDEITNENLNIQRELEMLSHEISEQSLNPRSEWKDASAVQDATAAEGSEASNTNTIQGCTDPGGRLSGTGVARDMNGANCQQERESYAPTEFEHFEMSNIADNRQWQYLNTSQVSIRSEFQSYRMLTVELKKDPVYEDFGFSVSDGLYERGVFINRIRKGGPADLCLELQPYDRILQVNSTCTQDFDCCLTVPLIATAGETLALLVARASYNDPAGAPCEPYLMGENRKGPSHFAPYLTNTRAMKRIVV